jgi:cyclopropane-fatty-acyl-phospholipid synthase
MTVLSNQFSFALESACYGPLYGMIQFRMRSLHPLDPEENWDFWTRPRNSLLLEAVNSYPPTFVRKFLVSRQLKRRHEVGISSHYDISNEFYKLFLDKRYMFYSCADFHSDSETLEEAQENKANFILDLLGPKPGERILDLGCGWGAMLRRVYEETSDKDNLLGFTLSKEQVTYIKEHYGFNVSLTNFITTAYAEESVDKIYSIGAWEHVRPNEITTLLRKLYRALKPGGKLVQHFFCLSGKSFPISMVLGQIFFPGSVLSSYQDQVNACQSAGFRLTHESVHDYRPTLKAWYNNLVANRDKAIELVGVTTYNKYLIFFPVSWKVFDIGQAQVHRLVLEKSF